MNHRPMPWKGEKDPYKIWLSEVILQQTRVEQGWAYYEKFIKAYPTIEKLAKASDQNVFKLWEGLGYYNRCRNLLFTARHIVSNLDSNFPNNYESLLALKGVGTYTAAAIASFAYNLPYAVVDGNVFRVFSRFFGIDTPIDTQQGINDFVQIANENLDKQNAGKYNQALMDFGATVCKPAAPLCINCVFKSKCVAFLENKVNQLPVKIKSIQKKKRNFDFFCFSFEGKWLLQKRSPSDIWGGLYQFYLVENTSMPVLNNDYLNEILINQLGLAKGNLDQNLVKKLGTQKETNFIFEQILTHQLIKARFIVLPLVKMPLSLANALWVNQKELKKYPFPKIINHFFEKNDLSSM